MTLFEHETGSIILAVRQRTIGNASAIAIKDMLACDIPHPFKSYFRMVAQSQREEEMERYRASSRFNLEHPEVQSLQKQINSVLIMNHTFAREEFLQHLDDAVHLIINYFIRPQWTLRNYFFASNQETLSSTIVQRLGYFDSYVYLKELICMYLKQKHIYSLTETEFQKTIWKLDGEFIRRKSAEETARLLTSSYYFLNYPSSNGTPVLPVKGLIKFFEDKGLVSIVRRLEEKETQGTVELNQKELTDVLEEARQTDGDFVAQQTWANERTEVQIVRQEIETTMGILSAASEADLSSIELFMENGDRKRFIKKIFRQSELAMVESLEKLDSLSSWKEASVVIDEIFIRYEVDPYCTEAERFVSAVKMRFR